MTRPGVIVAVVVAGFLLLGTLKTMSKPTLRYFRPAEFGIWWPLVSNDLLLRLDEFRHRWGAPVRISPASGSLGREDEGSESQHNVLRWGEVRAVDVMPQGMDTSADKRRALQIARDIGFTGIGIYPAWKPSPGMHLDVREDRAPGNPALWAGIQRDGSQVYVGISEGLA